MIIRIITFINENYYNNSSTNRRNMDNKWKRMMIIE